MGDTTVIHDTLRKSELREAINNEVGPHAFVPSEFSTGAGFCDRCGGGPGAEIHQKPVDQLARIADALERIANQLEAWSGGDEWPALDVRVKQ